MTRFAKEVGGKKTFILTKTLNSNSFLKLVSILDRCDHNPVKNELISSFNNSFFFVAYLVSCFKGTGGWENGCYIHNV